MADAIPTTPHGAVEVARIAPARFIPTPTSRAYVALLDALDVHIADERDLTGVEWSDPAFRGWLAAAERSLEAVTGLLRRMGDLPVLRGADELLLSVAGTMDEIIGAETEEEARDARISLAHLDALRWPGHGAEAMRVDHMIAKGIVRLHELAALDAYRWDADPDAEAAAHRDMGPSCSVA